jgi:Ca-activated chloride channel homolog
VLCRFTAFVAADVRVVNEGGVVHRVLQPVEAPAGWTMFERVGLAAAAMPMARMSLGGLRSAEPFASRPLGKADARLGAVTGRVGPGRSRRRRSGGFATHPLGGADLAPYRRRAAQLATLLESDRPLPRLGPDHPGVTSGPGALDPGGSGGDLGRRLGLVKVGVDALVADLESVDAVEEEVAPLRDLAARLAPLSRPAVPPLAELQRLRERTLAVLRAFAAGGRPGGDPAPEPAQGWGQGAGQGPGQEPGQGAGRDRGAEFWKR